MTQPRRRAVAVVGPGDTDDETLLADAEGVGRGVAAAALVLVTGGLGGVMAAAARGAASAGGLVVGLLPGDAASDANPWVGVALPTGMGQGRNVLVVRGAEAVVAVGGSWGTLAEVALARRLAKPVVSLRGWRIVGGPGDGVIEVATADDAVAAVLTLLS